MHYMKSITIGISGAEGSFSEEAAQFYVHKYKLKRVSLVYLISVEGVLAALEEGSIDRGIFPIENSTGGVVIEAVHAMARHVFKIERIFGLDIHQNLLVRHGTTASQIKSITSHDQALKQCRMYLKRAWNKIKLVEYPDTALAASDLASGKLHKTTAVIASRVAAEVYDLDVLEESVQDLKFNVTNFVVARTV
jgi:prephenate dehydratase